MEPAVGIDALPDELVARVLAYLPSIGDFGRASRVCRAWHAGGSPVEQALHLRIAAHGGVVPAAGAACTVQQLCLIELLRGARALSDLMSAGGRSSAAVGVHGRLLAWGTVQGNGGALFFSPIRSHVPKPVARPPGARVTRVAVGYEHVLALTHAGKVLSFGRGSEGQLGHGDREDRRKPMQPIQALRGIHVTAIAAGASHSLVLTDEGATLSFGRGSDGRLGHGDEMDRLKPRVIEAQRCVPVVAIAAGACHSMVLTVEGAVLSFGTGSYGRLGHGDERVQLEPMVIEALRGVRVVAMAAGGGHSLVLTDEGGVLSFGAGVSGQLGHGDDAHQYEPKVIEALRGVRVVAMAAGGRHSLVLTDGGTVLSFGGGGRGQLGHGDDAPRYEPKMIEALRSVRVVAIAAGDEHSMVLTCDGCRVLSFGENHDGQLGRDAAGRTDGTPAPISAPGVRRGPRKMLEQMSLVSQDPRL